MRGDDVVHGGRVVDGAYRDNAVADRLPLAGQGVDLEPVRRLFRENRIVSSITAEIDQKADFEVLSDPVLLERYSSADDVDVLSLAPGRARSFRARRRGRTAATST